MNLPSLFLAGNQVRIIHNHASMLSERECEDMALRISERSHSYSYHMQYTKSGQLITGELNDR